MTLKTPGVYHDDPFEYTDSTRRLDCAHDAEPCKNGASCSWDPAGASWWQSEPGTQQCTSTRTEDEPPENYRSTGSRW